MTHVYYYDYISGMSIGKNHIDVKNNTEVNISINVSSPTPSMYGVSKYLGIEEYLYKTNNFSLNNASDGVPFDISNPELESVSNDWVLITDIPEVKGSKTGYYYDAINEEGNDVANSINLEFEEFCNNLGYSNSCRDVYYNGDTEVKKQRAFGGNAGGRNAKFKSWKGPWSQ